MNTQFRSNTFALGQDHATIVEPKRHFNYFAARLPNEAVCVAFGFALSACLLAASAAGIRSGIISFFALTGLIALLYPHAVVWSNGRNALLWLYPAWTLFSILWSVDPARTTHQVLLLLPTIAAGIILGGMPHRAAVGAGAALALATYIGYSLAYGASVLFSDTGRGGEALTGITTGKNYFGHIAATSLMTAPLLMTFARGRWIVPVAGAMLFIIAASGFALWKSHATGSMLATIVAFMVLAAAMVFRLLSWQFRIVLVAAILGVIVLYVNFGEQLQEQLFAAILKTFNKDVSLTGRTVLWDYADRLIAEHRLLGFGYGAFWYYSNPEAWTIWRMMGVQPMSGFNFHNTMRDTVIEGGWIGLAMYVVGFGYALIRATSRALTGGDLASAVGLAFITYFIVRMPVESTGIGAVTVDTLLLITFLSVTLAERKAPRVANGPFRTTSRELATEQRSVTAPRRGPITELRPH